MISVVLWLKSPAVVSKVTMNNDNNNNNSSLSQNIFVSRYTKPKYENATSPMQNRHWRCPENWPLKECCRWSSTSISSSSHRRRLIKVNRSICWLTDAATGGSYDWAKGVAGIKYSYTIELRDRGNYGFMLPLSQVVPTGEETWAALRAAVEEMEVDECWVRRRNCT